MSWTTTGGTTLTTTTWVNAVTNITSSTGTGVYLTQPNAIYANPAKASSLLHQLRKYTVDKNWTGEIVFPDGTVIKVDQGNFRIEDKDAKITYKANRNRDWNKYLAGSDLLEEFINYLGSLNLSQKEVMELPIESFITWLIVSAAEKDEEDVPQHEVLMLEHKVAQLKDQRKPRCKCCGRFMRLKRKNAGLDFCSGAHMDKWSDRNL